MKNNTGCMSFAKKIKNALNMSASSERNLESLVQWQYPIIYNLLNT